MTALITTATPNFLIADGLPVAVRKTVGGDAHEARTKELGPEPIMIGMPTLATLKLKMNN